MNKYRMLIWSCTFAVFTLLGAALVFGEETQIDLLVVYTPDLEDEYGGYEGVEALVQSSVVSANEGFENSELNIELRLLGIRKVDYTEDESDMGVDLRHLRNSDGVMDEALTWREEVGADLVYLFRNDTRSIDHIGRAWQLESENGEPDYAFGVLSGQYALSGLVLQHEVGHNMGAAHDPDNTDGPGLYSYSYGHRFTAEVDVHESTYRTIMAYAPGIEINNFSSPLVQYNEVPTGTVERDNARTLGNSASVIANYRSYKPFKPVAVARFDHGKLYEDTDGDGFGPVTLDGSLSRIWPIAESNTWTWTWQGGSASGEIVDVELPVGTTSVTLTVSGPGNLEDMDTFEVSVRVFSPTVRIATSSARTFIIKENGLATANGRNAESTLGVYSSDEETVSPHIMRFENIWDVTSYGMQTLFLLLDGSVYGAGAYWSELYPDKTTDGFTRIFDDGIVSIASGAEHQLFVADDGKVWGIGSNRMGQLGAGSETSSLEMGVVVGSGAKSVKAGNYFSAILGTDGSLWVAGKVDRDEAFPVSSGEEFSQFTQIETKGVSSIDAGNGHIVYLKEDGSVWTYGGNGSSQRGGQLSSDQMAAPNRILDGGVHSIEAGSNSTYVLKEDGSVWGTGGGLISMAEYAPLRSDSLVLLIPSRVESISAADDFVFVLLKDGSVWAGGDNYAGQLGLGYKRYGYEFLSQVTPAVRQGLPNLPPQAIPDSGTNVDFDGDGVDAVRLDASGSTDDWRIQDYRWSWEGGELFGKTATITLPIGTTSFELTVTDDEGLQDTEVFDVTVEPLARAVDVHAGKDRIFIIREDGSLWTKGDARNSLYGPSVEARTLHDLTLLIDSNVVQVEDSYGSCIVLKSDGSVWGTGSNYYGQLGLGALESAEGFTQLWASGVKEISTEWNNTLFLMEDGTVWGMGENSEGQLIPGGATNLLVPTQLPFSDVQQVLLRHEFPIFLFKDGSVKMFWDSTDSGVRTFDDVLSGGVAKLMGVRFNALVYETREGDVEVLGIGEDEDIVSFGNYVLSVSEEDQIPWADTPSFVDLHRDYMLVVDKRGRAYTLGRSYRRGSVVTTYPHEPDLYFSSGIVKGSTYDGQSVLLDEDGSVWLIDPYTTLLSRSSYAKVSEAPVAVATYQEIGYAFPEGQYQMVVLDASKSTDDRYIESWQWSYHGVVISGRILEDTFAVGDTPVSLKVTDADGQSDTHEFVVSVRDTSPVSKFGTPSNCNIFLLESQIALIEGGTVSYSYGGTKPYSSEAEGFQVTVPEVVDAKAFDEQVSVLDKDGALWIAGSNRYGQLGLGYKSYLEPFTKVFSSGVIDFEYRESANYVCFENGSLWVSGYSMNGPLGIEGVNSTVEWLEVIETSVEQVETTETATFVMKVDGSVWAFGENDVCDLPGFPYRSRSAQPRRVLEAGAKQIIAENERILVIKEDGTLWGAGSNTNSALGLPFQKERSNEFVKLSDGPVLKAATANHRTMWLGEDLRLWGVGSNLGGALGLGYSSEMTGISKPRLLFGSEIKDFTITRGQTLALTTDGAIYSNLRVSIPSDNEWDNSRSWNAITSNPFSRGTGAPIAEAGDPIVAYTSTDYAQVVLDGSYSSDDWAISTWKWEFGNGIGANSGLARFFLPVGTHVATLTVSDENGNVSTDTVQITVEHTEAFLEWLSRYLAPAELSELSDMKSSDFDADGISNYAEFVLGTKPNDSNSKATLVLRKSQNGLFLNLEGSWLSQDLPVLYSTDLKEWKQWKGSTYDDILASGHQKIFFKFAREEIPSE